MTDITDNDKNPECEDFFAQKAFNRVVKEDITNIINNANTTDYTQIFLLMGA